MKYINTKVEQFYGTRFWKKEMLPPNYRLPESRKVASPYFKKWGFFVPMMYNEYFSKLCGIESDQYISCDLFYFYIFPCLSRREFTLPYVDKNNFSLLYPWVRQPRTVIKNRNGIFYDDCEKMICREEALQRCLSEKSDCLIKPTIDTGCGKNVALLKRETRESLEAQFESYKADYIVQKKEQQHEVLHSLNPNSLNTMRIVTYRAADQRVYAIKDKTFLRIGKPGNVVDNVGAGGGMCQVFDSGEVNDRVIHWYTTELSSLRAEYGVEKLVIPNYGEAINLAKRMHEHLPYFDLVGWDIAIGRDGNPFFIEYNLPGEVGVTQQGCGPYMGEWIDEVMDRVSMVKTIRVEHRVNIFRSGYDHILQLSGPEYKLG